ncbi:hypothetical protein [Kitasatospora sp. A2-31]|uniref:hypothetical protein n=1 Tax=Kitasatospora sp. A2-31 TaxID=2916414 RepID=UPI001EEAA77C|nr:hypothetical protein [Kitasatospora sp. A2-31]MCG6494733.1 hypothetical protein [Kitasatospora sp. A2-31]
MPTRSLPLALVAVAAAVTLTACGPGDPEPAATGAGPIAGGPAATAPTGGATAEPGGGATGGCIPPSVPANHRIVNLAEAATETTVHAKDTRYLCNGPAGSWADAAGEAKTYTFAAGATAKLSDLNNVLHPVPLARFAAHSDFCLNHTSAPDTDPCYDRHTVELVLDSSGRITKIYEVGRVRQVVAD